MGGPRSWIAAIVLATVAFATSSCRDGRGKSGEPQTTAAGKIRLVLKQQPLWGDPAPFQQLLAEFARKNPDVEVVPEYLPNASDLAHQFYLTSLEGGAA